MMRQGRPSISSSMQGYPPWIAYLAFSSRSISKLPRMARTTLGYKVTILGRPRSSKTSRRYGRAAGPRGHYDDRGRHVIILPSRRPVFNPRRTALTARDSGRSRPADRRRFTVNHALHRYNGWGGSPRTARTPRADLAPPTLPFMNKKGGGGKTSTLPHPRGTHGLDE